MKSTHKNPIEKHRAISKKRVISLGGDESTKNIKSDVEGKYNEKLNIGTFAKRPPPPKYAAPLPPTIMVGAPSVPPHTDVPSATDVGKPPPRPLGAPPDFPSPDKTGSLSHPVLDTQVYAPDMPLITITGDQKIPYREKQGISKNALAAGALEFSTYTQDKFFAKLASNPKTLQLINDCQLSEKEAAAIHAYTIDSREKSYYIHINNQFRHLPLDKVDISDAKALINAGVQNVELAELIAALISGMRKLPPLQTSDSAYLPLGRNVIMYPQELDLYTKDAEVNQKTFMSTTVSATSMTSGSVDFWDQKYVALVIYQRVNGNARDIGPFSDFPDEQEVLFMPNTKFKVMFRSEPVETTQGASKSEVAALEALSSQELYEKLKRQAESGDANKRAKALAALEGKEFSDESLFEPGKASEAKDRHFQANGGTLEKTFISIMEIPHDSNRSSST